MTEEQYLSLCEKYLNGTCTLQEETLLKEYQQQNGIDAGHWDAQLMGDQQRVKLLLKNKLQQSIVPQQAKVVVMRKWWYAAAAILIFTVAGIYLTRSAKTPASLTAAITKKNNNEILPGTNKAVLTLSNGKEIVLDGAGNGVIERNNGMAISKSGNGITIKNDSLASVAANTFSTITIPRGGKYDITLPDGTKVWLNSSSSLTFPTAFTGTERKVTLTGEAYFEVAKNKKMPFKINVNNKQVVEVLGTHFNVNAYADEQHITTTLLEGSVKVNTPGRSVLIKPGEMAVNNLDNNIAVKPADIDEIMAWKNGMFVFNNENIVSIMKKVSRWYDVDITFKGNLNKANFTGNYSRNKSLTNLLKNIELMDEVDFVIEGRRITIIEK